MDTIGSMLVQFGSLTAGVWATTEYLPRAFARLRAVQKDLFALLLGPLYGLIAQALGLVDAGAGWRGYAAAPFIGLLATVVAGVTNDYGIKPLLEKMRRAS